MGTTIEAATHETSGNGDAAPLGTALQEGARPRATAAARYQRIANEDRGTGGESLADFLGVFSIGLGLAQVLAPRGMSKLVGIKDAEGNARLMRALGAREISNGIAILSRQQPEKALWSRVAGDALH